MKKIKPGIFYMNNERGNVFFALFGAVAVVGVIGAASMSIMRGPLTTMVEVNKRTQAESQMQIASKMAVIEAVENISGEDCDADGAIEPIHARTGAKVPANGGLIPNSFGVTKTDPWGTEYGYCVWDAGVDNSNAACNESAGEEPLLEGDGTANDGYTVIAIISAGPDRTFDTTCNTFAAADGDSNGDIDGSEKMASKPSGTDDIIIEATYGEASTFAGGLWTIKTGDPTTATTTRDVEVTQNARFGGQVDLDLLGGSLILPNEINSGACSSAANEGVVRRNTLTNPPTVEICDWDSGSGAGWVSVAAGATSLSQLTDDDTAVILDDGTPEITFDVNGTEELSINATTLNAGSLNLTTSGTLAAGNTTITGTILVTEDVTLGNDTGADTVTITAVLDAQGNVDVAGDLDVQGSTILGNDAASDTVTITATLNAQGDADFDGDLDVQGNIILGDDATDTVNVTGLLTVNEDADFDKNVNVDGVVAINNSGTADPALDVTGNIDLTGDLDGDNATFTTVTIDGTGTALTVTNNVDVSGTIETDGLTWQGNDFIPSSCPSGSFNRWDGNSWECDADGVGGGGASGNATDELQDIEEVLNRGSNANGEGLEDLGTTVIGAATATGALSLDVEGKVGATQYCANDDTDCFTTDQMNQTISEVLGVGADAGGSIDLLNLNGLALGSSTINNGTNTDVRIDVTGDVAATEYCDADGANCFDAASVATLVGGAVTEIDDLTDAYHDITTDFDGDTLDNDDNLALGHEFASLDGTTPGARNTAIGATALVNVTTAIGNVAVGYDALTVTTTGGGNTAVGDSALSANTGSSNTAIGSSALESNTTGSTNVAIGDDTMRGNEGGSENIAIGFQTFDGLNEGGSNTIIGFRSARSNTTGGNNVAIGANSFGENTEGSDNVALGANSLRNNTIGVYNIAIGRNAMGNSSAMDGDMDGNITLGYNAGRSLAGGATEGTGANYNLMLGYQAGDTTSTGDNNIIIGYDVEASSPTVSREINIGNTIFGIIDDSSTADPAIETQMAIGVANASAIDDSALFELSSAIKGFLPPRIADPDGDVTLPATGLIAYDSTDNELQVYNGTSWVTFSGAGENIVNRIRDLQNDTYIDVDPVGDGIANETVFVNNGSESMRIKADGKVGIWGSLFCGYY